MKHPHDLTGVLVGEARTMIPDVRHVVHDDARSIAALDRPIEVLTDQTGLRPAIFGIIQTRPGFAEEVLAVLLTVTVHQGAPLRTVRLRTGHRLRGRGPVFGEATFVDGLLAALLPAGITAHGRETPFQFRRIMKVDSDHVRIRVTLPRPPGRRLDALLLGVFQTMPDRNGEIMGRCGGNFAAPHEQGGALLGEGPAFGVLFAGALFSGM